MRNRSEIASSPSRRVQRGAARRGQLAAVAEVVFLESGYADTTMQAIATRAGASKETLYRHFVSKEALFAKVVETHARRILGGCTGLTTDGTPQDVLRGLGLSLFRSMNGSDGLSLFRIVLAEKQRSPELGAIFLEHGPGMVHQLLTTFLESATARRLVDCTDASQATRLFIGAVLGNYHSLSLVTPDAPPLADDVMESHVDAAVAMFMMRYRLRDETSESHMFG